jgi:hypothetical protein
MLCQWCGRTLDTARYEVLCFHCGELHDLLHDIAREADHLSSAERNGVSWCINRIKRKLNQGEREI